MTNQPLGMILIKKPEGKTSFQTLNYYKKAFNTKRLGHTGTLDRFATGLMIALVGSATRLAQYIVLADKTYVAEFSFGTETATLDPEGAVVRTGPLPDEAAIRSALPGFTGTIMQAPPAYSAIHIDGKRAYERVLAGEEPEMLARPVTVHRFELLSYQRESGRGSFLVSCSKGTYIRSLARDLALSLGTAAHVSRLDRTMVGPFSVDEAHDPESGLPPVLSGAQSILRALPDFKAQIIGPEDQALVRNGKPFEPQVDGNYAALCSSDDRLLAIMERLDGKWMYQSVFPW